MNAPSGPLRIGAAHSDADVVQLSLVVPTFNESSNISALLRELVAILDPALGSAYEIIVVDDDSPDRTWAIAEALLPQMRNLHVIRRIGERGLSTAIVRGWQVARGDVLAVIDGDLQHPPEVLLALWKKMQQGTDLAVASRHLKGGGVSEWALWRRAVSRGAQVLGLLVLPGVLGRVNDPMSGYLMVRRDVVQGIELSPLGYKILVELLCRCAPRAIAEVPYVFRERHSGHSKLTPAIYGNYLRHLLRLRFAGLAPERFLQFAIVGLSGVIVDMALLYFLSDPTSLGWGLTRSKLLAAELAMVNNFIWNDAWTYGDLTSGEHGWKARLRRFLKFQSICTAGLLINTILLNLQFNLLGMNRYEANAIAIAAVTGWNYWLNLRVTWRAAR